MRNERERGGETSRREANTNRESANINDVNIEDVNIDIVNTEGVNILENTCDRADTNEPLEKHQPRRTIHYLEAPKRRRNKTRSKYTYYIQIDFKNLLVARSEWVNSVISRGLGGLAVGDGSRGVENVKTLMSRESSTQRQGLGTDVTSHSCNK